jgi:hypothetical protein
MMRYVVLIFAFLAAHVGPSFAQNCTSAGLPNNLTNGTNADATQVMGNFGYVLGCTRDKLTAARTYFVSTTGSDSNNGLSSGAAFATIQKAINVCLTLDLNGLVATIQVAAGTYSAGFLLQSSFVGGNVVVTGDTTTPSNVVITNASVINAFEASGFGTNVTVQGFKVSSGGVGGIGVYSHDGAAMTIGGKMEFGAFPSGAQISAARVGYVSIANGVAYTISGSANYHMNVSIAGRLNFNIGTVTLTGTPAFAAAFVSAADGSVVSVQGNTYSGSATGTRYSVSGNSVIDTGGGGASYLPGGTAGSASTGGQYL